jgi:hypothetical protein
MEAVNELDKHKAGFCRSRYKSKLPVRKSSEMMVE